MKGQNNEIFIPIETGATLPGNTIILPTTAATKIELQNKMADEQAKSTNAAIEYLKNIKTKTTYRFTKTILTAIPKIVFEMIEQRPLPHDQIMNIEEFNWSSLRYHHINGIITFLKKKKNLSNSRINGYLSVLKGVAKECRMLKQIPLDDYQSIYEIKGPKIDYKIKERYIKPKEAEIIINYYKSDQTIKNIRDLAIFSLFYGCGLRRSELCGIKVFTIKECEDSFYIVGKGNKKRLIIMPEWVLENVEEWIVSRICSSTTEQEYLFVQVSKDDNPIMFYPQKLETESKRPKGISGSAIAKMYTRLCEQLDLKIFSPHDLRGSFCSNMFMQGTDMNTIKKMMGHSSTDTTALYDRREEHIMKEEWRRSKLYNPAYAENYSQRD